MTEQELQEQAEKYAEQFGIMDKPIESEKIKSTAIKHWLAGAKWVQEQDKWISVDVKPDKEFADILLYFGGEDCSCSGYYVKEYDVFMPHSIMYRGLTVTHWKPFTLTSIQ